MTEEENEGGEKETTQRKYLKNFQYTAQPYSEREGGDCKEEGRGPHLSKIPPGPARDERKVIEDVPGIGLASEKEEGSRGTVAAKVSGVKL